MLLVLFLLLKLGVEPLLLLLLLLAYFLRAFPPPLFVAPFRDAGDLLLGSLLLPMEKLGQEFSRAQVGGGLAGCW